MGNDLVGRPTSRVYRVVRDPGEKPRIVLDMQDDSVEDVIDQESESIALPIETLAILLNAAVDVGRSIAILDAVQIMEDATSELQASYEQTIMRPDAGAPKGG